MFLVLQNFLKVDSSISETNLRVAHLSCFTHILHELLSQIAPLKIVHRVRHHDSIVLLSHLVLVNQALVLLLEEVEVLDDVPVLLRKVIFVNQMLQRKISNHHDEVQNINSDFSNPKSPRISIHSDVRRVQVGRNKRKISMISNKHSLIVLDKKQKSEIFLLLKNFLTKSVYLSLVSQESS